MKVAKIHKKTIELARKENSDVRPRSPTISKSKRPLVTCLFRRVRHTGAGCKVTQLGYERYALRSAELGLSCIGFIRRKILGDLIRQLAVLPYWSFHSPIIGSHPILGSSELIGGPACLESSTIRLISLILNPIATGMAVVRHTPWYSTAMGFVVDQGHCGLASASITDWSWTTPLYLPNISRTNWLWPAAALGQHCF